MIRRVLVVGASGLLGGPVAHDLQQAGFGVRVMSRRPGRLYPRFPEPFELVEGDALDRDDVRKALAGCDAVHLSIDHEREDECVRNVVDEARSAGIRRVTYVSGTTVCEENGWFPLVRRKLAAERALLDGGVAWAVFCPGWFMEMLARLVREGRAFVFGTPRRRWHMVAVGDFARMVTESYRRVDAVGRRFYVHGPQALTVGEALATYCRVLHPGIRGIQHIPFGMARTMAWLRHSPEMRAGVDMVAYLEKVGERGDPAEADALLGAPRVTLDRWLQMRRESGSPVGAAV